MKIVISSGHGKHIRGASGSPVPPQCDEVNEARKVVEQVATVLREMGTTVTVFHDDTSHDQQTNLNAIVRAHNNAGPHDLDVSVHFNAYDGNAHGCEVLYASSAGEKYARAIVDAICDASGLTNRGPKHRGDLAFLNGTNEVAVLIEVCFCDNTSDCNTYRNAFTAISAAIAEGITGQEAGEPSRPPVTVPPIRPPEPLPGEHVTVKKGDSNADVAELQEALGVLVADGDFGNITHNWVKGFQSACGLTVDGIVGPKTWEAVDALQVAVAEGEPRLSQQLIAQICTVARESDLQDYLWPDRGMSPPGMVPGLALCFAHALRQFDDGDDAATVCAKALGSPDKDALTWLEPEFKKLGMTTRAGVIALRHLYVLIIGLAMRESSGRYCEGRDLSASNVQSETAEAGLLQTSYNIKAFSPTIEPLLEEFWGHPGQGFLEIFKENVDPTADNLNCFGSGDGVRYQWLSRFCPCFHIMVSAVGLRTGRQHWGPVNSKAVTIKREADDLLKQVQALVESVA